MLVGRDSECAVLADVLAALRAGAGTSLLVRGEAGIGKTALLAHLLDRGEDIRVITARGIESEVEMPFGGLHELLRPVLHAIADLPAVQREALAGALALGPGRAADRFVVHAATLGLLEIVARQEPLLVAVDDAHWLDRASLDALLFAARRLGPAPVAIVLSARSDVGGPLEKAALPQLTVTALPHDDALRVLAAGSRHEIAPDVRERLAAVAQGNPLALRELSAVLDAQQLAGRSALADPLPVGHRIEEAFAARAEALSPAARRALLVAAASDSNDVALVLRALDAAQIARDALEDAEAAGLVELDAQRVDFRHPLVRSAVYQSASRRDRRLAHQAIGRALDGDAEHDARAAWHFAVGALGVDESLAARLEAGAHEARRRSAYHAAAAAFERAASLTPRRADAARRLLAAAEARQLAGASAQAVGLLQRALPDAGDDAALRSEILALQGRIETWRGPAVSAFRMLSEDAVQGRDPARAALALADAVTSAIVVGDFARALEAARAARVLGERAGGIAEVVTAVQLGKILILVGEAREGHPLILRCEELLGEGWSEARALDLVHSAPALQSVEEYALADRILQTTIAAARERGAVGLLPYSLGALSELEARIGRWAAAFTHGAEAVQAAATAAQQGQLSYNLARLARLEAAKGLADACREHAARALEIAQEHRFRTTMLFAEWALGQLELGIGRPDVAATHLVSAHRVNEEIGCREPGRAEIVFDLIEALARDGRASDAERELERLEDQAARTGRVMALAAAARYRGMLSPTAWEEHFVRALALHDRTQTPFERARTELCFGERLRRERRRIDAREQLRAALQTFEALGAAPWVARAREELAASGERARARSDTAALDDLTPHELRVAAVVAEGATNREAALALFLSPKTVEAHLHSIYRKLGIRSRSELAALAAAGGLSALDDEIDERRHADARR